MRNIKLGWLLALTMIMMTLMNLQWKNTNKNTAEGIIALELAKTPDDAKAITANWNIQGAINNTYLDFLFIIVYSTFLFMAVYRTANHLHKPSYYLKYLAWFAPVAGLLDLVENYKMLQFLYDANNFQSAYSVSLVKWILVIFLFLLFVILSCLATDQER